MSEWQPIETLKPGKMVILRDDSLNRMSVGCMGPEGILIARMVKGCPVWSPVPNTQKALSQWKPLPALPGAEKAEALADAVAALDRTDAELEAMRAAKSEPAASETPDPAPGFTSGDGWCEVEGSGYEAIRAVNDGAGCMELEFYYKGKREWVMPLPLAEVVRAEVRGGKLVTALINGDKASEIPRGSTDEAMNQMVDWINARRTEDVEPAEVPEDSLLTFGENWCRLRGAQAILSVKLDGYMMQIDCPSEDRIRDIDLRSYEGAYGGRGALVLIASGVGDDLGPDRRFQLPDGTSYEDDIALANIVNTWVQAVAEGKPEPAALEDMAMTIKVDARAAINMLKGMELRSTDSDKMKANAEAWEHANGLKVDVGVVRSLITIPPGSST